MGMRPEWAACAAPVLLALTQACGSAVGRHEATAFDATAARTAGLGADLQTETLLAGARLGDGARFAAGRYGNPVAVGESRGRSGAFVEVVDASSQIRWKRFLPCTGSAIPTALIEGPGGHAWVIGWFDGSLTWGDGGGADAPTLTSGGGVDMFLLAFDRDGAAIWARSSRGRGSVHGYAAGAGLASFRDGACLAVGSFSGVATFGAGDAVETVLTSHESAGVFIARYQANGDLAWARRCGGRFDTDRGAAVATFADGSFLMVGDFKAKARFGAGEPRETTLRAESGRSLFVARYASDGLLVWVRAAGGAGSVAGQDAATFEDGSCVVTGWILREALFLTVGGQQRVATQGAMDMFVAHYDATGSLRWLCTAGGKGDAYAGGDRVTAGSDGSCTVTGRFGGEICVRGQGGARMLLVSVEDDDTFAVRFDASGQLLWTRRVGDH